MRFSILNLFSFFKSFSHKPNFYFARKVAQKTKSLTSITNPPTSNETPANLENLHENLLKDEIFSDNFEAKDSKDLAQIQENEDFKMIDKEKMKFIKNTLLYPGDDAFPERLVERPEKGVVWGLGGELLKIKKNFFKKGVFPTVEEIIAFLELEQGKDISLVDLHELKRLDLPRYGIIVTTFSARHNFKIAKNLIKALENLELPKNGAPPKIHGSKTDEWVMVCFKEIMVHLFVEESREEIDLEWKWRNPVTDEEVLEMEKIAKKNKGKGVFEPFDE